MNYLNFTKCGMYEQNSLLLWFTTGHGHIFLAKRQVKSAASPGVCLENTVQVCVWVMCFVTFVLNLGSVLQSHQN